MDKVGERVTCQIRRQRTTGPQGSGILSSMVAGNCLIVLDEERGDVAAGERVLVEPF